MDDKILEILMELKEGQTRIEGRLDNIESDIKEVKTDIKKLDTKMDNMSLRVIRLHRICLVNISALGTKVLILIKVKNIR